MDYSCITPMERRRTGRIFAGALVALGLVVSCHGDIERAEGQSSDVTAAPTHDPKVDALIAELDTARMTTALTKLVSFGTRNSTSAMYPKALDYVESEMQPLGYTLTRQKVRVGSKDSWNLIWERKGTGAGVVLVTAHLDSINQEFGSSSSAPGADDNGSGSVGVMEIARIFAGRSPKTTMRFILWTGEEEGLFGSSQYVDGLSASDKSAIQAVVNMDMIATINGGVAPGLLIEGASVSQSIISGLEKAAATYTTLQVKTSLHAYNSDHVPFIDAHLPAVLLIEGNDTANHNMHTHNDTLAHIDYDLMKSILTANVAYLAGISGVTDDEASAPDTSSPDGAASHGGDVDPGGDPQQTAD